MKQILTPARALTAALAALTLAGALAAPHAAFADGDKGKDKGKKTTPIIVGPVTKTDDPPPTKK